MEITIKEDGISKTIIPKYSEKDVVYEMPIDSGVRFQVIKQVIKGVIINLKNGEVEIGYETTQHKEEPIPEDELHLKEYILDRVP